MRRSLRISTVVVAAVSALAACGTSAGGNPSGSEVPSSTASGTQSSSASDAPTGKAPRVSAPLPTAEITANPCNALSSSQMTELGIMPPGKASTNDAGPICQWQGAANPSNAAFINVLTANKNGLDAIYTNHDLGKLAYFEPTEVDGYPGVYGEATDERSTGSCTVTVGVTDQLAVAASVLLLTGSNKAHPCDSANQIASAMIEHLKGAA